jgi:cytochrome c
MRKFALCIVLAAGCGTTPGATATWPVSPDAVRGHQIALEKCSRCHAVERDTASPVAGAPSFYAFKRLFPPEQLDEGIRRGITAGHEKYPMPVFQLDADEMTSLIAYLKTLQAGRAQ